MTFRTIASGLLALLLAALLGCPGNEETDDELTIVDEALAACVADALDEDRYADVDTDDLADLEHLDCVNRGVESLDGIQLLTGLRTLSVWENRIEDVTPLAELDGLRELQLGANRIQDLDPLAGLSKLERLGLSSNRVTNVDALSGLDQLTWLNLDRNELKNGDMDELCTLDQLTWLTLEHNYVTDDDRLDCLADEGVEIYQEMQGDPDDLERSAPAATPPYAGGPIGALDAGAPSPDGPLGGLHGRFAADGRVDLEVELDGARVAVIPEFAGTLVREGETVLYTLGARRVVVGTADGERLSLCRGQYAEACRLSVGRKGPGTASSADHALGRGETVVTASLSLQRPGHGFGEDWYLIDEDDEAEYGEVFEELLPYVLASPNQFDAGSCLFMATTGSMEILLNQGVDEDDIEYGGDTDLSERYLMNASDYVSGAATPWILTDLIYAYEELGGSMLDRDYPFQAGYVKDTAYGVQESTPSDPNAYFSCYYSWLDHLPDDWEEMLVETPATDRTVIFVDPDRDSSSQWAVAVADTEVHDQIKYELRTKNAPVMVVYNHFLYWHADIIVGYDDTADSGGCPMVNQSTQYFNNNGGSSYTNQINSHMDEQGGCLDKGIFYVRDSIYDGTDDEPTYQYSHEYGFSEKYSQRIIERTYNWVTYLSNHAYTVHRR